VGEHDMRRRHARLERRGAAQRRIPLLAHERDVDGAAQERLDRAEGPPALEFVELLIGEILEPRHERDTEQPAEAEELLGEAVRVGVVLARA
jgi:hypothetical protein